MLTTSHVFVSCFEAGQLRAWKSHRAAFTIATVQIDRRSA